MTDDPTIVKGCCVHCGGGIEFDAGYLDHTITCPHCGRETVLDGQRQETPEPGPEPQPTAPLREDLFAARQRRDRKWRTIARYVGLLLAVVVVTLLGRAFLLFLPQQGSAEVLTGVTGLLIGLALFVVALWIAVLWLLFPVFVYIYFKRQVAAQEESNRLLKIMLDKGADNQWK